MTPAIPDPHLRAALHHAPDAELQAPQHLSAQIIAAAHRAAAQPAPAQPAAARRWWPAWGVWRMGASGALASVLLAGVIGWIWQTTPPGPALDEAPAAADSSAAPAPVSAAAPATAPGAVAPTATATPAAPPAPRQAASPPPAAGERRAAPAPKVVPAPQSAPAAQPMPAPEREAKPIAPTRPVAAAAPAAPPAVAAAAAPAATPEATPAAAGAAPSQLPALADAAAKRSSPAVKLSAPTTPWADLASTRSTLAWQIDGQTLPPDTAWLQTLARLTAGLWQASDGGPAAKAEVQVLWLRDGTVVGRLRLGNAGALWCDAQQACQAAPLAPRIAAELAAALKEKRPR